ncbi:cytochrome P450 [Lizonia empirigonia]|nr:cytochrome P450 [Lizonia empirigonia]
MSEETRYHPRSLTYAILGSTLPFLFDTKRFITAATLFSKRLTAICISLPGSNIFFYQDPASLTSIWKATTLSSPIYIYSVALRHMFGMPQAALSVYAADDSGPYRKPHPESNVAPHNRVDHLTHEILSRAFTGSALNPTFVRFAKAFETSIDNAGIGKDWVEFEDLTSFFREHVGRSIIECLFGPSILKINPHFMDDLWEFDTVVPGLAKRFPSFLIPNAYRVRGRLLAQIKNWYAYARANFSENSRRRQKVLLDFDDQCDDAVAATDLGLMWTLADKTHISPTNALSNIESLQKLPLLNSVYAETLRHYSQAYVTRCSPHNDVSLGEWTLPRNQVAMVSTYTAHHSEEYWNTKDGQHSVTDFWAERFLIDPKDPMSGPLRTDIDIPFRKAPKDLKPDDEPVFSTQGLDGIWIPYGGGYGACPGRLFAKKLILYLSALMVTRYDVEVLPDIIEMDTEKFGLGGQFPRERLAFG